MTKGELIVSCLKLIENAQTELDSTTISSDPNYLDYTRSIVESINRGLNEVAKMRKLPKKVVIIDYTLGDIYEYYTRYDLDSIVVDGFKNDVLGIINIVYENGPVFDFNVAPRMEGNNVLVLPRIVAGKYIITYNPRFIDRLSYEDEDTKEINIPNEILDIIPYFVKAELFEEEEADKAVLARNIFHQYLMELPIQESGRQTKVKTIYRPYY